MSEVRTSKEDASKEKDRARLTIADLLQDITRQSHEPSLLSNLKPSTSNVLHRLRRCRLDEPPVVRSNRKGRFGRFLLDLNEKSHESLRGVAETPKMR